MHKDTIFTPLFACLATTCIYEQFISSIANNPNAGSHEHNFTDLDKLNSVKLDYDGKVFGSSRFSFISPVASKNGTNFISGQKLYENNHLASLV